MLCHDGGKPNIGKENDSMKMKELERLKELQAEIAALKAALQEKRQAEIVKIESLASDLAREILLASQNVSDISYVIAKAVYQAGLEDLMSEVSGMVFRFRPKAVRERKNSAVKS